MTPAVRPTQVEIDLGAVVENAREVAQLTGAKVFAVVKADAYGHGAAPVARALAEADVVHGFAVSLVEEGVELRQSGVDHPILVMGPSMAGGHDAIVAHQLTAMVSSLRSLEAVCESAGRLQKVTRVHLKFDTGMGRLGLTAEDADRALAIADGTLAEITGVATHFACADQDDPTDPHCMTHAQLSLFAEICRRIPGSYMRHAANSSGIFHFAPSHLDAVRPGIALYGAGLAAAKGRVRQAMRFSSTVTQIRDAVPGATVGYGALWMARRPSRLAVIPVGYADGVPRSLSGRGVALVHGHRAPMVGAVSMDMTVLDVTEIPAAGVGDPVVLLGSQGREHISTESFGEAAGLTEYEVTCGVSKRVPRVYR